ncbi:MAG: YbaY family lipoprotein, partial [Chloroflexi bacterium]|nr:YbaY family lipoprotein [Chloroflexota bacterium]
LVDGDLAWVTPIGVPVKTGVALVEGVELPLAFRPDLLKGAVTGTISGIGLDSASDPEAYGTALVIKVSSGETIGFQYIQPTGAMPVPYSVPYDPDTIEDDADYVVRGTIWENGTLWATEVGTPVITKGNGRSDIPLTVTVVSSPSPTPTAAPTPAPEPPAESGSNVGTILIVLLLIGGVIGGAALVIRNRKQ